VPKELTAFLREGKMRTALALAAFAYATVTADAASLWDHNGSVVYLEASGSNRQFYYQTPRPGLPVSNGTLLFNGRKYGDRYSGTAYVFSTNCHARGYAVSGPITGDERIVTLYGKAPRVDSNCRVIGYRDDVLVFTYQDSDVASANRIAMTIGKNAAAFHYEYHGRTIYVDLGPEVGTDHDWFLFEDLVAADPRLKTWITFGRTTGIQNAFATIYEGRRIIVTDSGGLSADTYSPMHYLILGHEIGHHICGHRGTFANDTARNWSQELEADQISGIVLRTFVKNGHGTFDAAIAAANRHYSSSPFGNDSHPPQTQRTAAIIEGYKTGNSPCFGRNVLLPTDPTPEEEERNRAEYVKTFCRESADGFCEQIRGADNRRRFDFWVAYHNMRVACQRAGINIPGHIISGNSISYPGIDCSGGQRARLLPQ
jgi:hypothetical protein